MCMTLLREKADCMFWNLEEAMIVLTVLSVEMIISTIPSRVAARNLNYFSSCSMLGRVEVVLDLGWAHIECV